jgi:hypothetical protein
MRPLNRVSLAARRSQIVMQDANLKCTVQGAIYREILVTFAT